MGAAGPIPNASCALRWPKCRRPSSSASRTFLDAISDDFARESGAFGKQDAKRLLVGAYLRNEKISVNAVVTDVRIDGDRARATIRVFATGGAGLLPERGQSWNFDSAWRRDSGRWKVYNAEWVEAL